MLARRPSRWFAVFCAVFLLAQGLSTLVARQVPAVDRAVPWLLATTHMQPLHSILHIATALLAVAALQAGDRATWWFAAGFGAFYLALGVVGFLTGRGLGLHLQPFDHPFHLLLGGLGVAATFVSRERS
jgi:uncharacterized membrane protein